MTARRPAAWVRALTTTAVGLALLLTGWSPARADDAVAVHDGSFQIEGSGYGHGWGMSQWGAYGAARQGLHWRDILGFYYPGTTITRLDASSIRVWLTADTDASLQVLAEKGIRLYEPKARKYATLPTGSSYAEWRVRRSGSSFVLERRAKGGAWKKHDPGLSASRPWQFDTSDDVVSVVLPGGRTTEYRGRVGLIAAGSGARTVNTVDLELYLRGVVPAEMPTSWHGEAVRAQAVAARSYAVRLREHSSTSGYDVCDTTACQVYKGVATTVSGRRTSHETSGGTAAVQGTARYVVSYRGEVALTQFSASNGGHTARGDHPYLTARKDPYDGVVQSQAWKVTLTARQLAAAWPQVGTVRELQVTARDGAGSWGGRVRTIKVVGSKSSVTVSGATFRGRFGLRSDLLRVVPTATAIDRRWQQTGGADGPLGRPTGPERDVADGRMREFSRHTLFSSPRTDAYWTVGRIRDRYRALGTAGSRLRFPISDEEAGPHGSRISRFENGAIIFTGPTGARVVRDGFWRSYRDDARLRDALGVPAGEEVAHTTLRTPVQRFSKGWAFWQGGRAVPLIGGFGGHWNRLSDSEQRHRGVPTGPETRSAAKGVPVQRFTTGTWFWVDHRVRETYGKIDERYRQLGAEKSRLGLPLGTEEAGPGGSRVSRFEGGTITWKSGKATVRYR
ncbi:SpoIID/LytB domain-containing protein [Desertihabitans brevis]|uniref:SpoIID/LytB domain-containing protein n=1 Tax=Desertihabitans brevis TaxID=2268447 RepID=A0A367YYN6_9ACTN|nr:SpoIID/LytB domain-containing protein [Desertihabitans brevis]RCK71006.1 SpoIID/LytB domain-containing protein [Desertihabitans brevis]